MSESVYIEELEEAAPRAFWLRMRETQELLRELESQETSYLEVAMTEARSLTKKINHEKIAASLVYAGCYNELIQKIRGK
jgi:hypothetical protein